MSAVTLDDKIWLLGGSEKMHNVLKSVAIYGPKTAQWEDDGPAFQHARENATAQVFDGRIYLFGGRSGNRITAEVEMFDPRAGHWQTVAEMPSPRFGLTSVGVDSSVWLIGGTLANNTSSPRVDVYYPASNRWELGAELTTGRSSVMAATLKGEVYVFGGFFFGPVASYERYDAALGQWQIAGEMLAPTAGSGYAADSVRMWLAGGMSSGGMTDRVMLFDGVDWTFTSPLSRAKSECAAAIYSDRLYVFGGQSGHIMGSPFERAVEIFDLATSVERRDEEMPQQYDLLAAYPNPFFLKTTIEVSLPLQDQVEILIYDLLGRQIGKLYSGVLPGGQQTFTWTAVDASGARLPTGAYFVRLQGERFQQTRKIFILY